MGDRQGFISDTEVGVTACAWAEQMENGTHGGKNAAFLGVFLYV